MTNVAPQALALLNNEFVFAQADALARKLMQEGGKTPQVLIDNAWRMALGRAPAAREKADVIGLFGHDACAALRKLALLLFNLNEFVYVD